MINTRSLSNQAWKSAHPSLLSSHCWHWGVFIGADQPLHHGEVRDSNLAWVRPVCGTAATFINFNSSLPSAAYIRQWTGSSLVQVMAWRLVCTKTITWTNANTMSIKLLGTNFSEIQIKIQSNLAYPDTEYPETSSSGRIWMGTDFFHYIHTRVSGNPCFRIQTAILGTKSPTSLQKCLRNPELSACALDVCIFVISL